MERWISFRGLYELLPSRGGRLTIAFVSTLFFQKNVKLFCGTQTEMLSFNLFFFYFRFFNSCKKLGKKIRPNLIFSICWNIFSIELWLKSKNWFFFSWLGGIRESALRISITTLTVSEPLVNIKSRSTIQKPSHRISSDFHPRRWRNSENFTPIPGTKRKKRSQAVTFFDLKSIPPFARPHDKKRGGGGAPIDVRKTKCNSRGESSLTLKTRGQTTFFFSPSLLLETTREYCFAPVVFNNGAPQQPLLTEDKK